MQNNLTSDKYLLILLFIYLSSFPAQDSQMQNSGISNPSLLADALTDAQNNNITIHIHNQIDIEINTEAI